MAESKTKTAATAATKKANEIVCLLNPGTHVLGGTTEVEIRENMDADKLASLAKRFPQHFTMK